jgi:hypothetical protein
VAFLVVVVLACFFTALLFDSCPLLDTGIVTLKFDARVGWEIEDMLHGVTGHD